ncbi:hypothetical protein OSH11_00260 [Kaistia dalseonensis]|uniref:Uncharacterized protein n=1 Tax=Kaistia dalseonensis TaxID=410840 RepID=A0ABU0H048_9HYPH|nr:hypothetical protein [Kaistia dalseonensis]MCX5493128.1 hypothetical protein [Kaistia dalseonensis]MDQ0435683.1 hypothetical protein [Kaistia dalseonensis]
MSPQQPNLSDRIDRARDQRLQDQYKALNPHLAAALLHAKAPTPRGRRTEPCGGDSDMD